MNITIITPFLPYPLNSGGAQGQYNVIDQLRSRHHISIIFPINGKNRKEAMEKLKALWPEVSFFPYSYYRQLRHWPFLRDKMVRALKLKLIPHSERFKVERALKPYGFYFSQDFVTFVNQIARQQEAELIQVDFYPYIHLINYLHGDSKKVFIQHEIRYIRNERLLSTLTLTDKEIALCEQTKQTEIDDMNKYDAVVTVTDIDKDLLKKDGVKTPIYTSPSAVNSPVRPYQEWNGNLSFVGGYSHIPNQEGIEWFIKNVLPLLHTDAFNSFNIIGGGWSVSNYTTSPKLAFKGFVEDLADAVSGSIMVVPILTGSGMRMKILEAAALGSPIVTTSVGVEGINLTNGDSCLIADTPEEFAKAIIELINSEELRTRLTKRAQSIYLENYSVKALTDLRDNIYHQIEKKTNRTYL